ncbi:mannitol dehydrogenase family protein [Pararhizobium sp. YC-54]|uniref:mannitol dehydrogenase family protein n=1 Tax=Pararhizobium sp. YC-54 TaxID=2986920 RepID=UPI0021F74525|nr:mannitol dehydrogenase family protein [Pararhizobium sp. YC-54]MCV9998226.1 mannitol dehydrogenase family protein [Pararhizobium sp. YC-54]
MITPIVQFGTSRFLQAHADLFVSEALERGEAIGRITVVQTTGSAERAGRLTALAAPEGFPVITRGLVKGAEIDRAQQVTSVARALSTADDWDEVKRIVATEAEVLISNTGDTGYAVGPDDLVTEFPASFPGKLLILLHGRYRAGGKPLTILPCELVARNGDTLKKVMLDLQAERIADQDFGEWLSTRVIWGNTLVDRIVSEPLQPAGAVAEPYALWAIEAQPGLKPPCTHPSILLVDDLSPYEKLKLHILNLGHTVLADLWLKAGRQHDETVKAILKDRDILAKLMDIYETEVLPGFAARNLGSEAASYVALTLDRFGNPFLDHRIRDIANHHAEKITRRLADFRAWSPDVAMPKLTAIIDNR